MAATNRVHQDFISGTLSATLVTGGLTMQGDALADLVAVADPDFVAIVLDPEAVDGDPEIVWVTAHTGAATSATVLREQEGTVDREHLSGTKFIAALTADAITEIDTLETSEVTTSTIADGAVTTVKLDTDAVTVDKIANDAVGADQIIDGSVGTDEIADDAVTQAKLADAVRLVVAGGHTNNVDGTLSTSFADFASVEFTLPAGWTSAEVHAWGVGSYFGNDVPTEGVETRIEIGSDFGTAMSGSTPNSSGKTVGKTSAARHSATVTGTVTIALAMRETSAGPMEHDWSMVQYLAIRLT